MTKHYNQLSHEHLIIESIIVAYPTIWRKLLNEQIKIYMEL